MRKIKLTKGKYTLVDDSDYQSLNKHKWYAWTPNQRDFYAIRDKMANRKRIQIRMSRFLINAEKGQIVDHINHNTLDNRKNNLRICNRKENAQNMKKPSSNKSGYKGVSWFKTRNKWRVAIVFNGKQIHAGYFENILDAAKAYNAAATKFFGKFAHINSF